MSVEQEIREPVHPRPALANLAVGHGGEIAAEPRTECAHDLLDRIERNASDQEKLIAHCRARSHITPVEGGGARSPPSRQGHDNVSVLLDLVAVALPRQQGTFL